MFAHGLQLPFLYLTMVIYSIIPTPIYRLMQMCKCIYEIYKYIMINFKFRFDCHP